MRLNVEMLKWGLSRLRNGRSPDIRTVATRDWELWPEEKVSTPKAIYLDGAVDRIRALSPWRDWETERALIEGGACTHAASRAHLIEDVAIAGPFLYRGAAKYQPGFGPEKLLLDDKERQIRLDEAFLVSNNSGSHFFGNFLLDDFPLGLIPPPDAPAIVTATKDYGHEAGYRRLVSLPRPPLVRHAKVRRLTLYTDFAQNAFKAERYRELRDRVHQGLAAAGPIPGPGVYLKRGATGERRILANEAELETLLRGLGFDIVEPAELTAEEVARRTLGARLVVSVEGSHLSHAIYTVADDGAFLVLQPPDRFAMAYKEFTDRLDLRFGFLVGDPASDGFTIDLDDLRRMLDRLS